MRRAEYIIIKLLLMIYKAMGLAPYIVRRSPGLKQLNNDNRQHFEVIRFSASRFGCCYNLCLIVIQFQLLFVSMPLALNVEYPDKSEMTTLIEATECVLGNAVMFTIWFILGLKQKTGARLMNRLLSVNSTRINIHGNHSPESSWWFFFLTFITNCIVWFGLVLTEMVAYEPLVLTFFSIIVPSFILSWFITQYVFTVKLIENKFRTLNRELLHRSLPSFVNSPHRTFLAGDITQNDLNLPKIMMVRRTHSSLYYTAMEISEFYSLPILLTIVFASYAVVYNAYYLVVPFIHSSEDQTDLMILNSLFWLTSLMLPIAILASCVSNITREIRKTADIIRRLLNSSNTSPSEKIELRNFTMELLHRKVRFTACGLFSLDCTLVYSIVSMVATYLIILVQLKMSG